MNKVFIAFQKVKHEGDTIMGVFATEDAAQERCDGERSKRLSAVLQGVTFVVREYEVKGEDAKFDELNRLYVGVVETVERQNLDRGRLLRCLETSRSTLERAAVLFERMGLENPRAKELLSLLLNGSGTLPNGCPSSRADQYDDAGVLIRPQVSVEVQS